MCKAHFPCSYERQFYALNDDRTFCFLNPAISQASRTETDSSLTIDCEITAMTKVEKHPQTRSRNRQESKQGDKTVTKKAKKRE